MPNSITRKLSLTSEFNEVFSPPKSEPRKMRQPAFFRVARILRDEKKFGWKKLQVSGTVKFLLYSSDQREDLIFSATMPKAKNQSFWITDKFERSECICPKDERGASDFL